LKNWVENLGRKIQRNPCDFFKKLLSWSRYKIEGKLIIDSSKMELKHTYPNDEIVLENKLNHVSIKNF